MDLASEQWGYGRPVLVAHGLFGSRANWRSLARRLAAHYQVLVVDLRNHGASGHTAVHDYETLADDLCEYIAARNLERPSVIGHSMGGKAAMELACRAPERVGSLVIVDVAPRAYSDARTAQLINALLSIDLTTASRRSEVEEQLAAVVGDARMRAFLLMALVRSRGGGFHWKFNLGALSENLRCLQTRVSFGVFDGPVLFLRGERSTYLSDTDLPDILQRFPGAQIATIPGAAHWPHIDAPEQTYATIRKFLVQASGEANVGFPA